MYSYFRKLLFVAAGLFVVLGLFVYFRHQLYFSKGNNLEGGLVSIEKGDNVGVIAQKLSQKRLISQRAYFMFYYVWNNNLLHRIDPAKAGNYQILAGATIPEIARIIAQANLGALQIKVTFPEGLNMEEMASILNENGLPGNDFLKLAKIPSTELRQKFKFLEKIPEKASLEGYLFPDTYAFSKDSSAEVIVEKMLTNFGQKFSDDLAKKLENQKKNLADIIIMASIVEKETGNRTDMKNISSVFWNRIRIGQRLQSDATLEYVLGTKKIKHTIEETKFDSPYNTYQVAGLPPGPVSNPGLDAIVAAIEPGQTEYFFFLTDLNTKNTIFAKTFEEHVTNKARYGL